MLEVASDDTPGGQPDGHGELLAWRHRYTGTLSYYRCWTPGPVPLSRLIAIAVAAGGSRKINSSPSRAPAWTQGRSSAGNSGTAGP
jgi:hypothetical protein